MNAERISFTIIRNPPYSHHFSLRFSFPVECYWRQYFPYEAFTQLIYAYTAAAVTGATIHTTTATAAVHEDREQGKMERLRLSDAYAKYFAFSTSQRLRWRSGIRIFMYSIHRYNTISTTTTDNNQ